MFHPALLYDGVTIHPDTGIQEKIGNIPQPTGHSIDEKFTLPGTKESAGDGNLAVLFIAFWRRSIFIGESQVDLGHSQRFPAICSIEDDILHQFPAQMLRAPFSDGPQDSVNDIRFPTPIGSHNSRDPFRKGEMEAIHKGFESDYIKCLQFHEIPSTKSLKRQMSKPKCQINFKCLNAKVFRHLTFGFPLKFELWILTFNFNPCAQ
jgi:hypothetical protein